MMFTKSLSDMDKERIICGMGWAKFVEAMKAANKAYNRKLGGALAAERRRKLEKLIKEKK